MPAVLGASASATAHRSAPQLPRTVEGLLWAVGMEAVLFGAWFGLATILGRPSRAELGWARDRIGLRSTLAGVGEAAVIWGGLALAMTAVTGFASAVLHVSADTLAALRPQVENLVDRQTLQTNPLYSALLITVVSFGLGGVREELWRAATISMARALWPRTWAARWAMPVILLLVAVLFGLGHWAQGPGGILATAMLGAAFGAILVRRRSLWEAALAHGCFDAANFVLLALGWG